MEPLHNENLGITNDIPRPINSTIYRKEPRYYENLVIANKFCQSLGPSLYRGSIVSIAGL